MRITVPSEVRLFVRGFDFLIALALGSTTIWAQATASGPNVAASDNQPTDPRELLQLVSRSNGLADDNDAPWHMKFSFTVLDHNGKETEHGTFEEYWASRRQYKIIKTDAQFSETEYFTDHGLVRSGDQTDVPGPFDEIRGQFLYPLTDKYVQGLPATAKIEIKIRDFGPAKLRCITTTYPAESRRSIDLYGATACTDLNFPAIRLSGPWMGGKTFVFNNIASFRGRSVARDMEAYQDGNKEFTAHLETLESFDSLNEALFAPPPDARPLAQVAPSSADVRPQNEPAKPKTVTISASVAQGQLIKAIPPDYPIGAKEMGVTGVVVVQATIGKDGRIYNPHAISGPPMLRDAAVDAVKRWVYKPYLLNGEAVEVLTTVNVFFTLNH
jgi:TonB family protein